MRGVSPNGLLTENFSMLVCTNQNQRFLDGLIMRYTKFLTVVAVVAGVIGQAGTAAHANTYTTFLEYSAIGAWGGDLISNTPPYFGKVTLTEGGSGVGAYVDVHVDLYGPNGAATGFKFVDTGTPVRHSPFGFNLTAPSLATFTTTAPWVVNPGSVFGNNPFGTFNKELDCCASNGASSAAPSPLDFRVSSSNGITFLGVGGYYNGTVHFGTGDRFTSNAGGWWFVADVVALPGGATGLIASRDLVTSIPEPETYVMLLAGLGLMGFVARRRGKSTAA